MTPPEKFIADGGATMSIGVAALTWVANLNVILQLIATAVAIVAGLMSAWYYYTKTRALKKDSNGV